MDNSKRIKLLICEISEFVFYYIVWKGFLLIIILFVLKNKIWLVERGLTLSNGTAMIATLFLFPLMMAILSKKIMQRSYITIR